MVGPQLDRRRDYPLGQSPHEIIEKQVEWTPDAPALLMGAKSLSYPGAE